MLLIYNKEELSQQ